MVNQLRVVFGLPPARGFGTRSFGCTAWRCWMVPKNDYLGKTQLHAGGQSQGIVVEFILVIIATFIIVQAIIISWTDLLTAAVANASIPAASFADQ